MAYTRLFDIPFHQLEQEAQNDMLAHKVNGRWVKMSTHEVTQAITDYSHGLLQLGLQKGDSLAIIANNRPAWNIIDLAALQIGLIVVPIYPTISESEYAYILQDASVKVCFISSQDLYEKVTNVKDQIASLQHIYSFDTITGCKHWTTLRTDNHSEDIAAIKASIAPTDLATIIYTSGTTGLPKGVMLSHDNIISNIIAAHAGLPEINKNHRVLSFLPLCHIFERMVTYLYMGVGASIYYAESVETIGDNLKEVQPHFFTSVPRLLEKVYDKIVAKGQALSGVKKALFFWALELGLEYNDGQRNGWYHFKLKIARKLIFSKWQAALGGNVFGIVTGAAALQPRLAQVFGAAGIKVREGYGQTEASPVIAVNQFKEGGFKSGTVGPIIDGVEVKFADNGEILAKGPNIMLGYYNLPDKTAETVTDGWLHTGDVGELVDGKFLKITDRIKELFKTSGGKYVAPQPIENKLKESRFIEQIMIIGENQRYVAAIIVPAIDFIKEWGKRKGLVINTLQDAAQNEVLHKRIMTDIERQHEHFSHVEQVKQILVVGDMWSVETGELTPTMKIKRRVIMKQYEKEICKLYA